MEKLELTAVELMDRLNWKKSKVYYWMNSEKFETIETPEGLKVLLTPEEIEKYKNKDGLENSEVIEGEFEKVQNTVQENSEKFDKDLIFYFTEQIKDLSFQAGQTKLLTDNQKFYQDEYYRIDQEFKTLQESYKQLKSENSKLQVKIKELSDKNENLENNNKELIANYDRLLEENTKLKSKWWHKFKKEGN